MKTTDNYWQLLNDLVSVHAPSGSEEPMKEFLTQYVEKNSGNWKVKPQIISGDNFQDCLILVFGKPKTAIFAHMDSIGFTAQYENHLVKIGKPRTKTGYSLTGFPDGKEIQCSLEISEDDDGNIILQHDHPEQLKRGTTLTFSPNFRESEDYIQSPYMDNRLGIFSALRVCEDLTDGIICFSCQEEHMGGTVSYLAKYIYEEHGVRQALISDITWVTEGVGHGLGVAISMRDSMIPRKKYLDKILSIAEKSGIPYQLEVENAGGSDGSEIQKSPYPIDWCFIGAPEDNVHSPDEIVHKNDIESMIKMYRYLMREL